MARKDTWMPLDVGDYLRDTGHLTTVEHGAYMLLLMHAWVHGGSLSNDEGRLRSITKMSVKAWRLSRKTLIAFFVERDGVYRQKRLDEELAKTEHIIEQKSAAGKASAEARRLQREANEKPTSVEPPLNGCSLPVDDPLQQTGIPLPLPVQREVAATDSLGEEAARDRPRVNGRFNGFHGKMPNLNSPWSAWEVLTDGEVEVCGANAQRRPVAGGFYVDEVARHVADAAGIDGHTGHIDWRPLVGWLKAGYDSELILRTIKRVASKPDYEPKTNLKYFTPALTDAAGKAIDR